MILRILQWTCLVLGVGFLTLAALDYTGAVVIDDWIPRERGPFAEVEQTEFTFENLPAGAVTEVPVVVRNRSSQEVGIIGMSRC